MLRTVSILLCILLIAHSVTSKPSTTDDYEVLEWHGTNRVLFVSNALRQHLYPLGILASELAASFSKDYEVFFATEEQGRDYVTSDLRQRLIKNHKEQFERFFATKGVFVSLDDDSSSSSSSNNNNNNNNTTDINVPHGDDQSVESSDATATATAKPEPRTIIYQKRRHVDIIKFLSLGDLPITEQLIMQQSSRQESAATYTRNMWQNVYSELVKSEYKALYNILYKMQSEHRLPHLMVVDSQSHAGILIAHDFDIPVAVVSNGNFHDREIGVHLPAADSGLAFPLRTFLKKLTNFYLKYSSMAVSMLSLDNALQPIRQKLGLPHLDVTSVAKYDFMLLNSVLGFDYPQRMPANVFHVGPFVRDLRSQPELPSKVTQFLFSASYLNGTAGFVHFGNSTTYKPYQIQSVYRSLLQLTQPRKLFIVWLIAPSQRFLLPRNPPPHILILTAVEQQPPATTSFTAMQTNADNRLAVSYVSALLAYSVIRFQLTNCASDVVLEGLYYGKTQICVPITPEQMENAARVVYSGVGATIDHRNMSVAIVTETIQDVIPQAEHAPNGVYDIANSKVNRNNPFIRNAQRIATLIQKSGGAKRAIEIIDSFFDVGVNHLKPADESIPFYSRYNWDLLLFAVFALWVQWRLLIMCFRCCCCRSRRAPVAAEAAAAPVVGDKVANESAPAEASTSNEKPSAKRAEPTPTGAIDGSSTLRKRTTNAKEDPKQD